MNDPGAIAQRKNEHLELALAQSVSRGGAFGAIRFEHCALPELDLDEIDLSSSFLGRQLRLPFVISSMTGGACRGEAINRNLAEAAEALGIPFAVGSQRIAIEGGGAWGIDGAIRRVAPSIPLWANLGAAQLVAGYGLNEARRAVEMIGADALIIHLNPLQEAVQQGGDRRWKGVLAAIENLVVRLGVPVLVKEIGYGISASVARLLADAGVSAIDVAGAGGTAWAAIEAARATDAGGRAIGGAFADWGIATPAALVAVRKACPDLPMIGSGGVRNGVDAAKAIRLGADLVGQAGAILAAAMESSRAVQRQFEVMAQQLRICCLCTGSRDLAALRRARLIDAIPVHDV